MNARSVFVVAVIAWVGGIILASQGDAQVKQGKTRPLKTKQLMAALVRPNCAAVGDALKGAGPADDKAWEVALTNAALLNESGHVLMADGRCPDGVWAGASKTLQDCSQVLVAKLEAKDAAGAREAMSALTKSCGTCHAAHKK